MKHVFHMLEASMNRHMRMIIQILLDNCRSLIMAFVQKFLSFLKRRIRGFQRSDKDHIRILHLSKDYLVVHKPYDMLINFNEETKRPTLQAELSIMLPHLVNTNLFHGFHFVHRLDFVTSGVICIPLNKVAARTASQVFEKRAAKKFYLALVHGHVQQPCITISQSIGFDKRHEDNRRMCTMDSGFCQKPKKAITRLVVLEYGYRNGQPATKVLLYPETGRQHQLRVHCAAISHIIIGDYVYSDGADTQPYRTFLHAYRLILKNKLEDLDVKSTDPFEPSNAKNRWKPTKVLRILDEDIINEIAKPS